MACVCAYGAGYKVGDETENCLVDSLNGLERVYDPDPDCFFDALSPVLKTRIFVSSYPKDVQGWIVNLIVRRFVFSESFKHSTA